MAISAWMGFGVLDLVDEHVREPSSKVVTHRKVVAQQVPGPNEQVVKLGSALGSPLFSVVEHELSKPFKDWLNNGTPGLFQFFLGRGV